MLLSWESAIYLCDGEKIIKKWNGNCEAVHTITEKKGRLRKKHKAIDVKEKKGGVLVLTNQRMLWLEKRGRIGKSFHTRFEIPFDDFRGISLGGALRKYVSITDDEGEKIFHLSGVSGSSGVEAFRNTVYEQVNAWKQYLKEEKQKDRVQILLDFSFVKDYMGKGGLVMQTVKCTECGANVTLPESGNQVNCEHCGSILYAQDIFDKIKALIG
jgi:ribosomal protein S27E